MEKKYRERFLLILRTILVFSFTAAAIFRSVNFQGSLEEFQILGIFAMTAVILIVLLEFAAALSFLTGKYMKQVGLVLALVIICATIGKFILNWSVYLKEFPKVFSFDDTVHNLIYHLTLILLGALIHKYINNGIIRFEAISMNNERSVPTACCAD